jgi:putative nucleotidyltransferase with HDIG domain
VVLEQPLVSMTAADEFRRSVILTLIIGFALVTLASNVLLRQRLDPVARLQEGTKRLAAGDFTAPVDVSTGDEFEELASSFNSMATSLREQLDLLGALQELDREALEAHSDASIVAAGARRVSELVYGRCGVIVAIARRSGKMSALTIWKSSAAGTLDRDESRVLSSELDDLQGRPTAFGSWQVDGRTGLLDELDLDETTVSFVLPLLHRGICFGAVVLTGAHAGLISPKESGRLRQLVDQLALALSHSLVLERLSAMSWGTLEALARTIDANSPWTAGHSERVTRISMAIGRQMGLGTEEIDRLHRGGLLHDVGKIGIPAVILDKPGPLDAAELETVRAHPVLGARILEPIHAHEDVIGIVRHHHEQYGGGGYPDGLAGLHIPFLARVLAVADVYDALVSHRPYRAGWASEIAIEHIRSRAGSHFDPDVVSAFLELVEGKEWPGLSDSDAPRSARAMAVTHA